MDIGDPPKLASVVLLIEVSTPNTKWFDQKVRDTSGDHSGNHQKDNYNVHFVSLRLAKCTEGAAL